MKKILIIVPYAKVYPPMNGGMQRCLNIVHQLAKYVDLTVITKQDKNDFMLAVKDYPALKDITVFSTLDAPEKKDIFSLFPARIKNALRYRWYKKQLGGPADSDFLEYYAILRSLLKRRHFNIIMLENLATLNAVSVIRRYQKEVKIIYDAHNVDTNLAVEAFEKKEIERQSLLYIKDAESGLYNKVDAVIACSEKDKADFEKLNNDRLTVSVVPNGVYFSGILYDEAVRSAAPASILFCGSLNYTPNSEGLCWFYKSIWPIVLKEYPALKMLVVGSGGLPHLLSELLNDNKVTFTGSVDDVRPYYNQAAISIVPLKSGSGTRLKILEAMSYGLPVVSTTKGAEGIEYTEDIDMLIADTEQLFAQKIIDLLRSTEERIKMQRRARTLIEKKYDWNIIGKKIADLINECSL